jgi:putative serine protease PepD
VDSDIAESRDLFFRPAATGHHRPG